MDDVPFLTTQDFETACSDLIEAFESRPIDQSSEIVCQMQLEHEVERSLLLRDD